MRVANPIYDVVFRYLLDDNKIAKPYVSKITGLDVVSLSLRPSEHRCLCPHGIAPRTPVGSGRSMSPK